MTEPIELRLMRYLDGEASPEEAREVERWLEESAEGRALAQDLDAVGDAVRMIADERGAAADGIADAVLRRVQADAPASLQAARERKAQRSGMLWPAIGLSLAAAAAVTFLMRTPQTVVKHPGTPLIVASAPVAQPASPASASAPEEMTARDGDPGAAIESVDFGAQNGTIFMVASGPEVTPVIWLVDDGEATEG